MKKDKRYNDNREFISPEANYYGGLWITSVDGRYYWMIENYDTDFSNPEEWEEIGETLYNAIKTDHL